MDRELAGVLLKLLGFLLGSCSCVGYEPGLEHSAVSPDCSASWCNPSTKHHKEDTVCYGD